MRDRLAAKHVCYENFSFHHEAEVFIENWRCRYNHIRPHGALGRLSPAAYARTLDHPLRATLQVSDSGRGEKAISVAVSIIKTEL